MEKKKTLTAALAIILIIGLLSPIAADAGAKKKWLKAKTSELSIIFSSEADPGRLFNNLRNRQTGIEKIGKNLTLKEKRVELVKRILKIFSKVRELKELKITLTGRERVFILESREQFEKLYEKYYGKEPGNCIAFYSAARKSVYIPESSFSAKMLSHELTHMVNDLHYKGTLSEAADEKDAYSMQILFK